MDEWDEVVCIIRGSKIPVRLAPAADPFQLLPFCCLCSSDPIALSGMRIGPELHLVRRLLLIPHSLVTRSSSAAMATTGQDDAAVAVDRFAVPVPRIVSTLDDDSTSVLYASQSSAPSSGKHSLLDEDSRGSSSGSAKKVKKSVTFDTSFPAHRIIEYQWPVGSGNYFMIQEQITEFLQIKSFKRKYPDFNRRVCDIEERR